MTDRAEQILRVVGPTLGAIGLALVWRDGVDATMSIAAGKLVLVGITAFLLVHAVLHIVGEPSE